MTFTHSSPFTPARPPCRAMAAPVMPAMSEWLCDVGMPKYHAATPHTMMATMAAASAMSAAWLSPPKSTILKMVSATADDTAVMAARPHEVADRRHRDGRTRPHGLRPHHGGDRVGSVGRTVHHGRAERQNNDEGEYRIAHERRDERP